MAASARQVTRLGIPNRVGTTMGVRAFELPANTPAIASGQVSGAVATPTVQATTGQQLTFSLNSTANAEGFTLQNGNQIFYQNPLQPNTKALLVATIDTKGNITASTNTISQEIYGTVSGVRQYLGSITYAPTVQNNTLTLTETGFKNSGVLIREGNYFFAGVPTTYNASTNTIGFNTKSFVGGGYIGFLPNGGQYSNFTNQNVPTGVNVPAGFGLTAQGQPATSASSASAKAYANTPITAATVSLSGKTYAINYNPLSNVYTTNAPSVINQTSNVNGATVTATAFQDFSTGTGSLNYNAITYKITLPNGQTVNANGNYSGTYSYNGTQYGLTIANGSLKSSPLYTPINVGNEQTAVKYNQTTGNLTFANNATTYTSNQGAYTYTATISNSNGQPAVSVQKALNLANVGSGVILANAAAIYGNSIMDAQTAFAAGKATSAQTALLEQAGLVAAPYSETLPNAQGAFIANPTSKPMLISSITSTQPAQQLVSTGVIRAAENAVGAALVTVSTATAKVPVAGSTLSSMATALGQSFIVQPYSYTIYPNGESQQAYLATQFTPKAVATSTPSMQSAFTTKAIPAGALGLQVGGNPAATFSATPPSKLTIQAYNFIGSTAAGINNAAFNLPIFGGYISSTVGTFLSNAAIVNSNAPLATKGYAFLNSAVTGLTASFYSAIAVSTAGAGLSLATGGEGVSMLGTRLAAVDTAEKTVTKGIYANAVKTFTTATPAAIGFAELGTLNALSQRAYGYNVTPEQALETGLLNAGVVYGFAFAFAGAGAAYGKAANVVKPKLDVSAGLTRTDVDINIKATPAGSSEGSQSTVRFALNKLSSKEQLSALNVKQVAFKAGLNVPEGTNNVVATKSYQIFYNGEGITYAINSAATTDEINAAYADVARSVRNTLFSEQADLLGLKRPSTLYAETKGQLNVVEYKGSITYDINPRAPTRFEKAVAGNKVLTKLTGGRNAGILPKPQGYLVQNFRADTLMGGTTYEGQEMGITTRATNVELTGGRAYVTNTARSTVSSVLNRLGQKLVQNGYYLPADVETEGVQYSLVKVEGNSVINYFSDQFKAVGKGLKYNEVKLRAGGISTVLTNDVTRVTASETAGTATEKGRTTLYFRTSPITEEGTLPATNTGSKSSAILNEVGNTPYGRQFSGVMVGRNGVVNVRMTEVSNFEEPARITAEPQATTKDYAKLKSIFDRNEPDVVSRPVMLPNGERGFVVVYATKVAPVDLGIEKLEFQRLPVEKGGISEIGSFPSYQLKQQLASYINGGQAKELVATNAKESTATAKPYMATAPPAEMDAFVSRTLPPQALARFDELTRVGVGIAIGARTSKYLYKSGTAEKVGTAYKTASALKEGVGYKIGTAYKEALKFKTGINYKEALGYKNGIEYKEGIAYKVATAEKTKAVERTVQKQATQTTAMFPPLFAPFNYEGTRLLPPPPKKKPKQQQAINATRANQRFEYTIDLATEQFGYVAPAGANKAYKYAGYARPYLRPAVKTRKRGGKK